MAKTFDPNRVRPGTIELVRDANGNYTSKVVGLESINSLSLRIWDFEIFNIIIISLIVSYVYVDSIETKLSYPNHPLINGQRSVHRNSSYKNHG